MTSFNISPLNTALVVLAAVSTTLIGECISWTLIYKRQRYQDLVAMLEGLRARQRVIKKILDIQQKDNQHTPERTEFKHNVETLRTVKKGLIKARMISSFIVGLCMLFIMRIMFWIFQGVVVAKLPFDPINMFRGITHNSLEGEDFYDCSAPFLYVLTLLTLRIIIRKLLGFKRPRTREPLTLPFPARLMGSGSDGEFWWQNPRFITVFMAGFYGYSLYKVIRKHQTIKHKIAISRNVSRLTGVACSLTLPAFLRPIVYGTFGKIYGINFEEMKNPDLKSYESFNKFFTRELKAGVRTISNTQDPTAISSPCDGRVLTCGEVSSLDSTIDCVKGRSYRLDEFLLGHKEDDNNIKESKIQAMLKSVHQRGNKLFSMVIYLAPSDYHRFHSPAVCVAEFRRHIAGYLDPVKPAYVNKHKDVFKNNERVNLFGNWNFGFFLTSFVGALNVGSIKLHFDKTLRTNRSSPAEPYYMDLNYKKNEKQSGPLDKYLNNDQSTHLYQPKIRAATDEIKVSDAGVELVKGEQTGMFEMGSTIVLVFEGPEDTKFHVKEGDRVWLGQELVTTHSEEQSTGSSSDN